MGVRETLAFVALGALALGATHGSAYFLGKAHATAEAALEQANLNVDAGQANARTGQAVTEAAGRQAQSGARYAQEANDARRQAESHTAPPPAGYVGGAALVDPAIAGPLLCRARGLRDDAPTDAC